MIEFSLVASFGTVTSLPGCRNPGVVLHAAVAAIGEWSWSGWGRLAPTRSPVHACRMTGTEATREVCPRLAFVWLAGRPARSRPVH
jgi:hypothetical protein